MKRRYVDFNSILTIANLIVMVLLVVSLFNEEFNEYVDGQTLILGLILCAETQVALFLERRKRDPFMILLAFGTIFYYSLRIYTLVLFPISAVFDRFAYSASDSNFALVFMIIANAFIYSGLYAVRSPTHPEVDARQWRPTSPAAVLLLLCVTFAMVYFGSSYWSEGNVPRAATALIVLLPPLTVELLALTYYCVFRRSLSRSFVIALFAIILLEIVARTLWGSRSALISVAQTGLMVVLAVMGTIRFPRKWVVLGIATLPIGLVVLGVGFAVSTVNRAAKDSAAASLNVGQSLSLASEAGTDFLQGPALDLVIPPITARAGYFDFSSELIAHRDQYSAVINVPAYFRSVVDNVLTPGFDLYDQPRLANGLQVVYRNWGSPSKEQSGASYQSDQFGVYGEFYVLFGYACLPLLFILSFLIKRFYVRIHDSNPFTLAIKRVVVLYLFGRLIDSFGLDWILGDVLSVIAAVVLYSVLFASRRVAPSAAVQASPAQ